MPFLNIPKGRSDFETIRRDGFYYVDKTGLIGEILKSSGTQVTLITRPRRFGKTLGMSTLECFLDIQKFLSGIFAGTGYQVDSNKEHGEGRSDVVVCDTINGHVAIFEAKRAATLESLESECDKALQQIDERMYARDFEDAYDSKHIHCYGIAFYKKRCLVKRKS